MISGTVHEADPATFEDRVGEYLITPPADPPCSSLNNPNRPALRVARERAVPDEGAKLAVAEGEMDGVVDVSSAVALAPPPHVARRAPPAAWAGRNRDGIGWLSHLHKATGAARGVTARMMT
jgi:hypothetical protein